MVLPHFCSGTATLYVHGWGVLLSELEMNVGDASGLMQPQTPCCLSGC